MKKLRLDLDELKVESFDTDGARGPRGTVHAHAPYTYMCDSTPCVTDWSCEGNDTMCDWMCSSPPASGDVSCTCP
ncbi:MAG TPA: hypothetical protein VF142_04855 [Longimicrobium sp.]